MASRTKKAANRRLFSFRDRLLNQFSGHVHAVICTCRGDFVSRTLFSGYSCDLRFSAEALTLRVCAKLPKEISETATNTTKFLMVIMVYFLMYLSST